MQPDSTTRPPSFQKTSFSPPTLSRSNPAHSWRTSSSSTFSLGRELTWVDEVDSLRVALSLLPLVTASCSLVSPRVSPCFSSFSSQESLWCRFLWAMSLGRPLQLWSQCFAQCRAIWRTVWYSWRSICHNLPVTTLLCEQAQHSEPMQ